MVGEETDDDYKYPGGVYPTIYMNCLIQPMSQCLKSLQATRRYLSVATLFLAFKLLYFSTVFKNIGVFSLIVFRSPSCAGPILLLACPDSDSHALMPSCPGALQDVL